MKPTFSPPSNYDNVEIRLPGKSHVRIPWIDKRGDAEARQVDCKSETSLASTITKRQGLMKKLNPAIANVGPRVYDFERAPSSERTFVARLKPPLLVKSISISGVQLSFRPGFSLEGVEPFINLSKPGAHLFQDGFEHWFCLSFVSHSLILRLRAGDCQQ